MSQIFPSGGQSIGVSASTSVLPMNIQDCFLLGRTGLLSLQSKGISRVFSNTTVQKQILWCSAFFIVQLSHPYSTTGKTIALTLVSKVMAFVQSDLFHSSRTFFGASSSSQFWEFSRKHSQCTFLP